PRLLPRRAEPDDPAAGARGQDPRPHAHEPLRRGRRAHGPGRLPLRPQGGQLRHRLPPHRRRWILLDGILDMNIKPAAPGGLDMISLGECMVRLSPTGRQRIEFANEFEAWIGGGEYNVAYAVARMGLRAGWVSRLPDNYVASMIKNHARGGGLDISDVVWCPFDGVGRADRVGLNFTEVGTGVRGSVTMYDRGHSAASNMKPGDIDWKKLFSKGVRWFHTGGIFSALSPSCAEVALEALKAAHEAGVVTSYDLNFRSKLWSSKEAMAATEKLLPYVKVLIGNEEDFMKVLGMKIEGVKEDFRGLEVD